MARWSKYFNRVDEEAEGSPSPHLSGIIIHEGDDSPMKKVHKLIRVYEISTKSNFVRYWQQGSGFCKNKSDILNRKKGPGRITWKLSDGTFSNVPLIHCGISHLECHQGPDHFVKVKSNRQEAKQKIQNGEHHYSKKKTSHFLKQNTKKLDCPAKIQIKHLLIFPDYETDGKSEWKRKQKSKELNNHLRLQEKDVKAVHEIHITLPDPATAHVGHIVGSDASGIRQQIDEKVEQKISKLLASGVRRTSEIQRHLNVELNPILLPLDWLLGTWESDGPGEGCFPTIKPFRYTEILHFSHVGQPVINFMFNAFQADTKKPLHRECGFIRMEPGTNRVAFIIAQNSGLAEIEEGELTDKQLVVQTSSLARISFAKEPHVQQIHRVFQLRADGKLEQTVSMATNNQPLMQHLHITYRRSS